MTGTRVRISKRWDSKILLKKPTPADVPQSTRAEIKKAIGAELTAAETELQEGADNA